ncbi:hypothetical protein HD806DRAFT_324089 [Xylariaceae sp. AK1471]|nr:hypothetical protein HD806DRAFT_324089 [Xylariaceae sp. AK1471]
MKSWQYDERQASTRTKTDPHTPDRSLRYLLKRTKSSDNTHQSNIGPAVLARNKTWHPESKAPPSLFWPQDLLPIACPEARIITWGYYTLRNGNTLVPTQPDIFAHANELFRELRDFRSSSNARERPLIFIAHSIGGIIVKEVLRQAEFSNMKSEQDILSSTAATIFFGCPHRAVEQAPLVDVVSSMAEASSGITTESLVASALYGVHDVTWSEAQESFVRLWHHFNFVVKTYQERRSDTNNLISC